MGGSGHSPGQEGREFEAGAKQCRSIGASPARPPLTHPRLLQDSRPGGGSRRHDPRWAAPPARSGHYIRLGQSPPR